MIYISSLIVNVQIYTLLPLSPIFICALSPILPPPRVFVNLLAPIVFPEFFTISIKKGTPNFNEIPFL